MREAAGEERREERGRDLPDCGKVSLLAGWHRYRFVVPVRDHHRPAHFTLALILLMNLWVTL